MNLKGDFSFATSATFMRGSMLSARLISSGTDPKTPRRKRVWGRNEKETNTDEGLAADERLFAD